jgi:hypothetical protein
MAPPNDTYVDNGKKASSADQAIIEAATNVAIGRIGRVINALKLQINGPADSYLDRLLSAYFKTNASGDVKEIAEVFEGAWDRLYATTKYVIERGGRFNPVNFKTEHFHGLTGQTSRAQSSLGLDFFSATVDEQPATIIHEAIHRWSSPSAFARFRYMSEKYVFDLYPDLPTWSQATYKKVKDWVDVYVAFAQGSDDKDYFGKWGGLPMAILQKQMIGRYANLGATIIEAKGHLDALGLYSGAMDANTNDEFTKAMDQFCRRHKQFSGGILYDQVNDWQNDARLLQLRRARESLAPERRPH